ncbi:MAG: glycosyltransferase [bacterium]
MKYSIIIPTLNEEKLIGRLLSKIARPELKNKYDYEIIVSDGGSKDKTIEIAKNYCDKIVVHSEARKQNIAEGRNEGAKAAEGQFFIFLNGDIGIPDIHKFFEVIENKFIPSKYLAMTCSVYVFPEEEKFSDKVFLTFYNVYFYTLNIIHYGMGRGECQVIRKEVFQKVGGYKNILAAGEDMELYGRIRKIGKIMFVRDLVIYESPRRYRRYGHFRILSSWFVNSFYIFFFRRSQSKEWEQIR